MNPPLNRLLLQQTLEIPWSQFPGPSNYNPADIVPAIKNLLAADSSTTASVCDQLLYAVGNNHAGTRYPASDGVVPILLACALSGNGWASWTAFEVLNDLCGFEPQGFAGEPADLWAVVRGKELELVAFAQASSHLADLRVAAIQLLGNSLSDKPVITSELQASLAAGPRLLPHPVDLDGWLDSNVADVVRTVDALGRDESGHAGKA